MDDKSLGRICSSNSYFRSLCKDDTFWRNRTIQKFSKYLGNAEELNKYKSKTGNTPDNWRSFYVTLVDVMERIKEGKISCFYVEDYKDYELVLILNFLYVYAPNTYVFDKLISMHPEWSGEYLLNILKNATGEINDYEKIKMLLDVALQRGFTLKGLKTFVTELKQLDKDEDYDSHRELIKYIKRVYIPSVSLIEPFPTKDIINKLKMISNLSQQDYETFMRILEEY